MAAHSKAEAAAPAGWSVRHYHALVVLFAAFGTGMAGNAMMNMANFGASKDAALALSTADFASLLARGSAGYSLGKLFGGPLADMLGGKITLLSTLGTMGVCQLLIASSSSFGAMSGAWAVHKAAHAMTWIGVMLVARPWFISNNQGLAVTILSSSCRSGAAVGGLAGGLLLSLRGGWRGAARSTGMLTLAVAAMQLTLRSSPKQPADVAAAAAAAAAVPVEPATLVAPKARKMPLGEVVSIVMRSPKLWSVYACSALTTPTYDLTSLLPMWLDSLGGMSEVTIGQLGSIFPLAAVPAVLIAGYLHERLSAKKRRWLYAPLLCVSAAAMLVLSSLRGRTSPLVVAPLLAAVMAGIGPSFYVPNYDFILRFGGPYTGTLTALCDLFGNVFCMVIYQVYPKLLAMGGWPLVFRAFALMNLCAAGCIGGFTVMEARDPLLRSPFEDTRDD